jgi:hypothetical protein
MASRLRIATRSTSKASTIGLNPVSISVPPALVWNPRDSYHAPVVAGFESPDFLSRSLAKDET